MNRNRKLFAGFYFTAIAAILITSCNNSSNNPSETLAELEKTEEILELQHGNLSGHLEIPGELMAFEKVDIFPRVSGFISTIRVDRGSKVKKGDVLATVDAPELQAELAEALAKKHSSESQVQLRLASFMVSKDTWQRMLRLSFTQGAISDNELLLYKTRMTEDSLAHQSAIMQFNAATAAAEAKQQLRDYLTIRAPFDGIITDRMVHPGALVKPEFSKPMFRMSNVETLRLELAIPEAYAGKTAIGDTVFFSTNTYIGQRYYGIISRQSQSLNPSNRVEMIEADVMNSDNRLQAGMFAKAEIPFHTGQIWVVPSAAIITNLQDRFVVKVLSDGQHRKVSVVNGLQNGNLTQISGDLAAGDKILLNAREFYQ
jgi:membrane fusion protein, multidrug efflux system